MNNESSLPGLRYVENPNSKPQFFFFPAKVLCGYVRTLTIADCISGAIQEPEIHSAIDLVDGTSPTPAHQLELQKDIS